jgi:hypothetical protein
MVQGSDTDSITEEYTECDSGKVNGHTITTGDVLEVRPKQGGQSHFHLLVSTIWQRNQGFGSNSSSDVKLECREFSTQASGVDETSQGHIDHGGIPKNLPKSIQSKRPFGEDSGDEKDRRKRGRWN